MGYVLVFIAGFFAGGFIGVLAMCLAAIAAASDKDMPHP